MSFILQEGTPFCLSMESDQPFANYFTCLILEFSPDYVMTLYISDLFSSPFLTGFWLWVL